MNEQELNEIERNYMFISKKEIFALIAEVRRLTSLGNMFAQDLGACEMSETPGLMTFDEWSKLSAEDRHRYNLLVSEIQKLQGDNAKLRAEIVALEGVVEIMDCGHERRFSTLQIGATGNESTCALCENDSLKSQIVHVDQLRLKEVAESERLRKLILESYPSPSKYEMLRNEYNLFRHTAKTEIERLNAALAEMAHPTDAEIIADNDRLRALLEPAERACKVLSEYMRSGEFFDPETSKAVREWQALKGCTE